MKYIIQEKQLKFIPVVISALLLFGIFRIDTIRTVDNWGLFVLKIVVVPLLSIIAVFISFDRTGLKALFSRPIKPIRNFFIWLFVALIASFGTGFLIAYLLKYNLKSNPGGDNLLQTFISLPLVLLFEEIISFFILLVVANLVYRSTKNMFSAQFIGIIASCAGFALLHFSTYFGGSVSQTLIHIFMVQGFTRIFFNLAGIRTNSIIVPWVIHVVFDYITFGIGGALLIGIC